jgi:BirA family transcriptional regulator, biotin operon repressor / biotin---[acetyl-CoA-carboxylase] ligase
VAEASPHFPPGYTARLCPDDPFDTAIGAAGRDAEDGLLLWQDRADRFNAALVLRPLDPLQPALTLAHVGLLSLLEAFASAAPPETAASLDYPDRLMVNEACVGGIRVAHGPLVAKDGMADVPEWLVLGTHVQIQGDPAGAEPGRDLEFTNLFEEGCGDITAAALVEAFSRHFLHWIDRWQEQGFEALRKRYVEELRDKSVVVEPSGDAWRAATNGKRWLPLRTALERPSWIALMAGHD